MSLVDRSLPLAVFTTTLGIVGHGLSLLFPADNVPPDVLTVIAQTVLIAIGAKYIATIIPVCILAVYLLQKYYLRTSRQLRFLDLEAKSPLYTHFTETASGLATIRAFGWQSNFKEKNLIHLDASQKPYYLLFCIQRWLNLVLDLFVAGIAVVLVLMATELRHTASGASVGLALVNVVNLSQSLSALINSWTTLETSLGAISRLKAFVDSTPDEDEGLKIQSPSSIWPEKGRVEVRIGLACYGYF